MPLEKLNPYYTSDGFQKLKKQTTSYEKKGLRTPKASPSAATVLWPKKIVDKERLIEDLSTKFTICRQIYEFMEKILKFRVNSAKIPYYFFGCAQVFFSCSCKL